MPESSHIHGHDFQLAQVFWGIELRIVVVTVLAKLWDRLSGYYEMVAFLRHGSIFFHRLCTAIRQEGQC
eukprot:scaffold306312_cov21-Tisochrysis_lutea.AAC.1